jgi:hypothetical protein
MRLFQRWPVILGVCMLEAIKDLFLYKEIKKCSFTKLRGTDRITPSKLIDGDSKWALIVNQC